MSTPERRPRNLPREILELIQARNSEAFVKIAHRVGKVATGLGLVSLTGLIFKELIQIRGMPQGPARENLSDFLAYVICGWAVTVFGTVIGSTFKPIPPDSRYELPPSMQKKP